MIRPILIALAVSATAAACTPVAVAPVGYYNATVVTPDLVSIGGGVQVIADYDEPIFYADNFYWRNYNGAWYRSSYHTGGWAYAAPPRAVLGINHGAYVRYRPAGYVPRRGYAGYNRGPAVRGGYNRGPAVRDYRGGYNRGPAPTRDYRSGYNRAPTPAARTPDRRGTAPGARSPAPARDYRAPTVRAPDRSSTSPRGTQNRRR